jgi:hypothetical protein
MNDFEFVARIGRDGVLNLHVPLDPVDADLDVMVTIRPVGRGSAKAILDILRDAPPVDPKDVDEMERLIAAGALPVIEDGIFDEKPGKNAGT